MIYIYEYTYHSYPVYWRNQIIKPDKMKISNPQTLLSKLDDETYASIEERFGNISRFLGPGDTFKFTCDRSGKCCRDRFDNPILLSPYDVYRLQKNLNICSNEFAANYGEKVLGGESELPLMLLRFRSSGDSNNQCAFVTSDGCRVYDDRPLVCRMYPVGRIIDLDMNSYFFLTRTPDHCQVGKGKEYTIEEWLEEAQVDPYFEWNDRFHSLYMRINYKKYHSLDFAFKATFGEILYDFNISEKLFHGETPNVLDIPGEDSGLHINYELAKMYVERFLK